jgi:uncharacterized membrane protein
MDAAPPGPPILFEALIVPHRSLSPRGLRILLVAICLLCSGTSTVFWLMGAWPVMGFCGLEILLAAVLLRLNARAARASELVLLAEDGLRIVRTDQHGQRRECTLQPTWLRLHLQERPGRVPRLALAGRGVDEEIGASLGEAEKRDLAAALQSALHRWRNPRFDNPQLRSADE